MLFYKLSFGDRKKKISFGAIRLNSDSHTFIEHGVVRNSRKHQELLYSNRFGLFDTNSDLIRPQYEYPTTVEKKKHQESNFSKAKVNNAPMDNGMTVENSHNPLQRVLDLIIDEKNKINNDDYKFVLSKKEKSYHKS